MSEDFVANKKLIKPNWSGTKVAAAIDEILFFHTNIFWKSFRNFTVL